MGSSSVAELEKKYEAAGWMPENVNGATIYVKDVSPQLKEEMWDFSEPSVLATIVIGTALALAAFTMWPTVKKALLSMADAMASPREG